MQHPNSDQYPNAYCVKCGCETPTNFKHSVILANQSRAMKGLCSKCTSEVYRIMPKIEAATEKTPLTGAEKRRYPDAFCLKCQAHTPTKNAHTVILDNRSRAVTGQCGHCSHDVYRIIGPTSMQTVSSESVSKAESSKDHKVHGVPLPIKANLRLIKSPTSQRQSINDLASSSVLPRVLLGLIMVGLVAIGLMAMKQL